MHLCRESTACSIERDISRNRRNRRISGKMVRGKLREEIFWSFHTHSEQYQRLRMRNVSRLNSWIISCTMQELWKSCVKSLVVEMAAERNHAELRNLKHNTNTKFETQHLMIKSHSPVRIYFTRRNFVEIYINLYKKLAKSNLTILMPEIYRLEPCCVLLFVLREISMLK